jgi:hypothetical protein
VRRAANVVPIKKDAVEVLPPLSSPRKAWAKLITATWRETVEGIVKVGQMLVAASPMKKNMDVMLPRGVAWPERLEHGEFTAMVEEDLPFGETAARRLMAVARDPRIANRAHVHVLPPSWGTLYVLSKLDDEQWEKGIADGPRAYSSLCSILTATRSPFHQLRFSAASSKSLAFANACPHDVAGLRSIGPRMSLDNVAQYPFPTAVTVSS